MNETGTHADEVLKQIKQTPEVNPVPYEPPDRYLTVIERLASDPNVDIEKLRQIIDMKNREEDREAERAFNADMVAAQADIEMVVKNKENIQTKSNYADFGIIVKMAKPHYTKHGFSISFYQGDSKDGYIRVMADIMHRDGCTKTRHKDVPIDLTGIAGKVNKTKVHAEASSFMYGKRYIICDVFSIPTGDDDDGNAAGGVQYLEGDALAHIADLHKQLYNNPNDPKFFKFAGSTGWNDIPAENENKILEMLNDRKVSQAKVREPGEEG
jgi:hypothetical protein